MSTINIGEGMRFGMGVDKSSELVRGEAIDFDRVDRETGGQNVDSTIKMIQSQESLQEELSISVNASFQLAFTASGDLKIKLAQSHVVNDFSVYMLFKAFVANPPASMVNPRLKGPAETIYKRNTEEFRQDFGDVYIDTIIGGGELFGLFIFETHDESSKSDLSADLNLSIGNFLEGGAISAAFHKTIEKVSRRANMTIRAIISGGSGLQNPQNLNDLATLHSTFNQAVLKHPIDYQVTLKDFRFLPLPPGPSFLEQFVRKDDMEECGRRVIEAMKQRAQIEYILTHKDEFANPDETALKAALLRVDALIPKLGQQATKCANATTDDVDKECSLAGLESVVVNLPARLTASDPLAAKLADVRAHDSRAAASFLIENQPENVDIDKRPGGGRFMIFKNNTGGVFFRPDIDGGNAHVVYGAIFQAYLAQGHCEGQLGYPIEDENSETFAAPDRGQHFEFRGTIFFNARTEQTKTFF